MKFDICIPVNNNLDCLRVAIYGWATYIQDRKSIRKFILHIQNPSEELDAVTIIKEYGFDVEVVSLGTPQENMVHPMNRMFNACQAKWVVMAEQDVFICDAIDRIVYDMETQGFIAAGPIDTFYYDNINARNQTAYGRYARLSGEPGHYHSSLVILNKDFVPPNPFTIPEGYTMHGVGLFGGELYHGLRINIDKDKSKLAFFRQQHAAYGYGADILWGDLKLATHLYYSSHQKVYTDPGGHLNHDEAAWLRNEEIRFLKDYD